MNREVIQLGDLRLQTPSSSIPESKFNTPELNDLIKFMFECMEKEEGVGLAAPQIGINQRLFVFGLKPRPGEAENEGIPYTVVINPKITYLSPETELSYEGCLSIKGKIAEVPRSIKVKYEGFDLQGKPFQVEVSDYVARVIQHEYDHIEGVLICDRAKNLLDLEELLEQRRKMEEENDKER
jgi:peptide deformylase